MISDYIKRIRSHIGHELLLVPTVAILVRDDVGRLMLVRQADSGEWATVGGAIEPGESPEQAAHREAREEIGVDVTLTALVGCYGGPGFEITYSNGDEVSCISIVYDAVIANGTPAPDLEEVLELGWFTEAELETLPLTTVNRTLLGLLGLC